LVDYDSGGLADALITTRDGIVGSWSLPGSIPLQHPGETDSNMAEWEPRIRATVIDFELVSRLGFSAGPLPSPPGGDATARTISIWHLLVPPPANPGARPTGSYRPLARFDRPDEQVFQTQLQFLRAYADLRPDRATEIVQQLATFVPFLGSIAFLRPDAKRWTMELLEAVLRLAGYVEQRVKHGLACRRPNEYSPQVQPIILTPGHGSLPSGHATEAFAMALVLRQLLRTAGVNPYGDVSYGVQFMRLAARLAINRTVAGVHFPIDSISGALLGLTLGDYFLARVGASVGHATPRTYSAAHFDGGAAGIANRDFHWPHIYDVDRGVRWFRPRRPRVTHPSVRRFLPRRNNVDLGADERSRPLEWLWGRALGEWN
jgi:membrane-associated phospholipid phosphatase